MSSLFQASVAERKKVKLMVAIDGPSGSGKTFSSLLMAYGITGDWKRIAVADTENSSALYYAGDKTGDWLHIPFEPTVKDGYSPTNFVKLIEYAETLDVDALVIDSISHAWVGTGGTLDIANRGKGGSGWKDATPMQNAFIDKMRHSKLHIIATMRSKQDYAFEQNEKGKTVPRKLGMAPVQREGVDYEFGVMFNVDMNHYATTSKDRTGLFMDRPPFLISAPVGEELLEWANSETLYEGKLHQKKKLANLLWEAGFKDDRDLQIKVAKDVLGQKMSELPDIVRSIAEERNPKPKAPSSQSTTIKEANAEMTAENDKRAATELFAQIESLIAIELESGAMKEFLEEKIGIPLDKVAECHIEQLTAIWDALN